MTTTKKALAFHFSFLLWFIDKSQNVGDKRAGFVTSFTINTADIPFLRNLFCLAVSIPVKQAGYLYSVLHPTWVITKRTFSSKERSCRLSMLLPFANCCQDQPASPEMERMDDVELG